MKTFTSPAHAVATGIADARTAITEATNSSIVWQKEERSNDPLERAYAMAWNAVVMGDI